MLRNPLYSSTAARASYPQVITLTLQFVSLYQAPCPLYLNHQPQPLQPTSHPPFFTTALPLPLPLPPPLLPKSQPRPLPTSFTTLHPAGAPQSGEQQPELYTPSQRHTSPLYLPAKSMIQTVAPSLTPRPQTPFRMSGNQLRRQARALRLNSLLIPPIGPSSPAALRKGRGQGTTAPKIFLPLRARIPAQCPILLPALERTL